MGVPQQRSFQRSFAKGPHTMSTSRDKQALGPRAALAVDLDKWGSLYAELVQRCSIEQRLRGAGVARPVDLWLGSRPALWQPFDFGHLLATSGRGLMGYEHSRRLSPHPGR